MIESLAKADLRQTGSGTCGVLVATGPVASDKGGHEDVFKHGALRQQAVVLKHEPDCRVPEVRQVLLAERERVSALERDLAFRRRFERAKHV